MLKMFPVFELETSSDCNRVCPTCIRNSHPNREVVSTWFTQQLMPMDTIKDLLGQLVDMNFRGHVCLQHYNEPLMDPRIADIGRYAISLRQFSCVFICTNADYINEQNAKEIDGAFDGMFVALYMSDEAQKPREERLSGWFKTTQLWFTKGLHIPTHFSPDFPTEWLAESHLARPCSEPEKRLIINHKGECLLCCDDMVGNFGLGNIRDKTLHELWFGEKHQRMIRDLEAAGGRRLHAYCSNCPRP